MLAEPAHCLGVVHGDGATVRLVEFNHGLYGQLNSGQAHDVLEGGGEVQHVFHRQAHGHVARRVLGVDGMGHRDNRRVRAGQHLLAGRQLLSHPSEGKELQGRRFPDHAVGEVPSEHVVFYMGQVLGMSGVPRPEILGELGETAIRTEGPVTWWHGLSEVGGEAFSERNADRREGDAAGVPCPMLNRQLDVEPGHPVGQHGVLPRLA